MEHKTKASWATIGDKKNYYRSKWEKNYAYYLEWQRKLGLIAAWEHEPHTFWFEGIKRGVVSYKPDFCVITLVGHRFWVEVKGHYDPRSITKLKRFKLYFPNEVMFVIDAKWFKTNGPKLKNIVPGWESGERKKKFIRRIPRS